MGNDIILTGPPRSGTTLACYLLNKFPETIALHEPMNLQMFPDKIYGLKAVQRFFSEMRKFLLEKGMAISKVSEGAIPTNPFGDKGEKGRDSIVKKDFIFFDKPLSADFKLIIKHNAHFTFLLPELQDYFPVYIIIRHPLATIASWNSVKAPVSQGNLKVLETLDPALFKYLNSVPDLITRQVILLDKMYQAYLSATKAVYIRYEDIISSNGNALKVINNFTEINKENLESKNKNPLYDSSLIKKTKEQLLEAKGAYLQFYSAKSIEDFNLK
jgi:hypothetical protein